MSTIFEGVTPNKQEIKKIEGNEKNKVNEIGNIEILYESEKSETLLDWSQIVNIVKKRTPIPTHYGGRGKGVIC